MTTPQREYVRVRDGWHSCILRRDCTSRPGDTRGRALCQGSRRTGRRASSSAETSRVRFVSHGGRAFLRRSSPTGGRTRSLVSHSQEMLPRWSRSTDDRRVSLVIHGRGMFPAWVRGSKWRGNSCRGRECRPSCMSEVHSDRRK